MMAGWLIIIVGLIYACIAFLEWRAGHWPQAIIFAGYSFSNIGLYYGR